MPQCHRTHNVDKGDGESRSGTDQTARNASIASRAITRMSCTIIRPPKKGMLLPQMLSGEHDTAHRLIRAGGCGFVHHGTRLPQSLIVIIIVLVRSFVYTQTSLSNSHAFPPARTCRISLPLISSPPGHPTLVPLIFSPASTGFQLSVLSGISIPSELDKARLLASKRTLAIYKQRLYLPVVK